MTMRTLMIPILFGVLTAPGRYQFVRLECMP